MEDSPQDIIVPKWFLTVVSICMTFFMVAILPWIIWQTNVTMKLDFKMESINIMAQELDFLKEYKIRNEGNIQKIINLESQIIDNNRKINSLQRELDIIKNG